VFRKFLGWLERLGRRYVSLDELGNVMIERWYLLGRRHHRNISLHHLHTIKHAGSQHMHNHRTRVVSFVLAGGYTELVNHTQVRVRRPFSIAGLKATDFHLMLDVLPGTWTLFWSGNTAAKYRWWDQQSELPRAVTLKFRPADKRMDEKLARLRRMMARRSAVEMKRVA
jgi:hypothetical protein